ncbi:MAG: 3-keto-5-aminohexanoate cleavage protein [Deltaproteobacteria bacterium]|nr:3-keto-5-aminohexanoate cleavage protein [Deltaproteobacteria bacterium]
MSTPVILEVALNGVTKKSQNAAAPETHAEIAADALACFAEGAAIVHTHTTRPSPTPQAFAEDYLGAYRAVLAQKPDAILYPTVGFGIDGTARYDHVAHLAEAGAIRQAVLDPGSVNLGASGADGWPAPMDFVYVNSPSDVRHMAELCRKHGLGPSIAIFEPGWLRVILAMQRAGTLPPGALVKLYFAAGGYLPQAPRSGARSEPQASEVNAVAEPSFSTPPIPEAFEMYLAMLRGSGLNWAVAVLGGDIFDTPIAELAVQRGGHLRVGLEDHASAKSNVDAVRKAKALAEKHGRRLATCAEAGKLLGIPR